MKAPYMDKLPNAGMGEMQQQSLAKLNYQEALVSPCLTCSTSPCCRYLPLHTFEITNIAGLNHAIYLLNFEHIELGLSATGEWSAYYNYPCQFLNTDNFSCTIHNAKEQPQICRHYNPYMCWYKKVFEEEASNEFINIDREGLNQIIEHIQFDEERNITSAPDWDMMLSKLTKTQSTNVAGVDIKHKVPNDNLVNSMCPAPEKKSDIKLHKFSDIQSSCNNCQSYCCKTLIFPQFLPQTASNLDYFRFCLGFPGIEIGVSNDAWSIIVKTTCQHSKDNKCQIYEKPERPLLCKYYDATSCSYKKMYEASNPEQLIRVDLDNFDQLLQMFYFNDNGDISAMEPLDSWEVTT